MMVDRRRLQVLAKPSRGAPSDALMRLPDELAARRPRLPCVAVAVGSTRKSGAQVEFAVHLARTLSRGRRIRVIGVCGCWPSPDDASQEAARRFAVAGIERVHLLDLAAGESDSFLQALTAERSPTVMACIGNALLATCEAWLSVLLVQGEGLPVRLKPLARRADLRLAGREREVAEVLAMRVAAEATGALQA
ncbi:MAG: hypothetical protein MJD61_15970 [Proteobacteria bacterium]|nr:hypothetical protein [Pseudomonadota bacterium]